MPIEVDEETKEALREAFSDMKEPVKALVFTSEDPSCMYCKDTVDLMKLFEETSSGKFSVEVYEKEKHKEIFQKYNVSRVPTVLLLDGLIRYTGIPGGEEARGFVETVIRISQGESGLRKSTKESLKKLTGYAYIEVIVTPSCPYCPYAAVLANMFAFEAGGKIVSNIVDAVENPDIADKYGISAVPAIIVNGTLIFVGVPRESELLREVINRATPQMYVPEYL